MRPANCTSAPGIWSSARWVLLLLSAGGSLLVYLFAYTLPMPLVRFYAVPHVDAPKLMGVSYEAMHQFTAATALLFALFLVAFVASLELRPSRVSPVAVVLSVSALLCGSVLLMYPIAAGDLFAYIAEADMVLRFHANPFATPAAEIPNHPLLPYLDYPGETTHYGPLWLLLGILLRLLSGPDLLAALLVFKAAAAGFLLATAWLIYLTLRPSRPEWAVPGTLLVAWNPLLIFELAGNGHNDIAMMLPVALAFYLHSRRRLLLALSALAAAALVKYIAAALLPLFLLAMLRHAGPARQWLPGAALWALGAGLVGVALLAVVGTRGTVDVLERQALWFTTSLQAAAFHWLSRSMPAAEVGEMVSRAGRYLFGALFVIELYRVWRRPDRLADSAFRSLLALLLLAISWFEPWYATWVIPLAALASGPAAMAALGLTLGAFLTHSVMGFAWRLDWHEGDMLRIHLAGAAAAWLPTAALGVGGWVLGVRGWALGPIPPTAQPLTPNP